MTAKNNHPELVEKLAVGLEGRVSPFVTLLCFLNI
jgi:hypothetical protein